ncbi:NAD(+) synthase, partial [Candidatus Gottesmanbacteria bacterium]|nr:NAD(+) synthase [Candidatus Gottesmanbacteria bacterium]
FTRFGDEASDIEPLRNLYKTQVYELAQSLGIPEPILTKKPTAGLWEGQTDEGEFGFTYKQADAILSLLFDEKKSVEEVIHQGCKKEVVEKVQARVSANAFKHHLPIIP